MTINIDDNIEKIDKIITKMKSELKTMQEKIRFTKDEILRLEGCKIVYSGFKNAGLSEIKSSKHKKPKKEKTDNTSNEQFSYKVESFCSDEKFEADYENHEQAPLPDFLKKGDESDSDSDSDSDEVVKKCVDGVTVTEKTARDRLSTMQDDNLYHINTHRHKFTSN